MFLKNLFRRNRDEDEYYDEYEEYDEYDEYEDEEYDEDGDEILDLNEIDEAEEYDDEYEDEYDDEEYEAEEYEDEYDEEYDEYEEDYDEDLEILDLNEDEEYYEEERGFGKIIGTISRWSTQQKVVAAATAVTVLAAAAIGGVAAFTALRPAEEVAVETPAAIEETPAEVVAAAPKDSMVIPEFKEVNVTGDSIEKDLTLYFTDDKDEKITGEEFAVKLVKPGSTESLAEAQETLETDEKYLEALDSAAISGLFYTPELQKAFEEIMDKNGNDGDKAKSELKQLVAKFTVDESELNAEPAEKEEPADEEKSDEKTEEKAEEKESVSLFDGIKKLFAAGTVKAEETTGSVANKTNESLVGIINAATGHAITIKDYYLLKKQDDMAVYGKAVQDLKGTEYKDDDKDGMIYIKSIDSGDYTVCMVPHSGSASGSTSSASFAATKLEVNVNVKEEIEYKKLDNIEKKVVSEAAAGDVEPEAAAPVEAVMTDTVEFVESRKEGGGGTATVQNLAPAVSGTNVTLYSLTGMNTVTFDLAGAAKAESSDASVTAKAENGKVTITGTAGVAADKTATVKVYKAVAAAPTTYTVTFDSAGGSSVTAQTIEAGGKAQQPTAPTKAEDDNNTYTFAGWTLNGSAYDFNTAVNSNITLVATWTATAKSTSGGNSGTDSGTTTPTTYTIKFLGEDGSTVISQQSVEAGGAVTVPDIETREGFTGSWSPAVNPTAEGNATYTLVYTQNTSSRSIPVTGRFVTNTTTYELIATYTVKVVGTSTQLYGTDGKTKLYTDKDCTKAATLANYKAGASFYVEGNFKYYGWQTINGVRYYFDKNGNPVSGTQTIQGVTYNFGSDGALLTSGTGIDVSRHQGNIDWSQVKSAASFAIIRCGYRGSSGGIAKDSMFLTNMAGAKANGLRVGAYFYSMATTEAQAVEEASLAIAQVQAAGGISLPLYFDMEASNQAALSPDQKNAIINAFCQTVRSAGYRPGLYANYNWLTNKINTGALSGISIWCARYNTTCGLPYSYDMWQYTSKGSVPGIAGNVDLDISYF